MTKINSYQFSEYRVNKAKKEVKARSTFEKIVSAIEEFFGIKKGSALQRTLDRSKFYGNNLQSYKYEEGFLSVLKNLFASKSQKQKNKIRKERLFQNKIIKNLAFIKKEAANCKAAVSMKDGKAASLLFDAKSDAEMVEMVERAEELKRSLDRLSREVKLFPELLFYNNQEKYKQLKADIEQALSDLNETTNQCSAHFVDRIFNELQQDLESLKKAESPEEKQAVKEKVNKTEQYAQSKGFLINEQDRKLLNEAITVADYLVELAPKGGLMDYNEILTDIFSGAVNELRDIHLTELEGIDDLDVLERAVMQIDRKINKFALQFEFTSNLMNEETRLLFQDQLEALREDVNVILDEVFIDRIESIQERMNAFNAIDNFSTIESRKRYEELKREIAPDIDQLQQFVEFLGEDFITVYSPSIQKLSDDIEYKGWLIQNPNLIPLAQNQRELVIGMDQHHPLTSPMLFPAADSIEAPTSDGLNENQIKFTLNCELEVIKAKIKSMLTITSPEQLEQQSTEVEHDLLSFKTSLMEAIIRSGSRENEDTTELYDILEDVEVLMEALTFVATDSEIAPRTIEEADDVSINPFVEKLEQIELQFSNIKSNFEKLQEIDNQQAFMLNKLEVNFELIELNEQLHTVISELKQNSDAYGTLLKQSQVMYKEQEELLDMIENLTWQGDDVSQSAIDEEKSRSLLKMVPKVAFIPSGEMLKCPPITFKASRNPSISRPFEDLDAYPLIICKALKDLETPSWDSDLTYQHEKDHFLHELNAKYKNEYSSWFDLQPRLRPVHSGKNQYT